MSYEIMGTIKIHILDWYWMKDKYRWLQENFPAIKYLTQKRLDSLKNKLRQLAGWRPQTVVVIKIQKMSENEYWSIISFEEDDDRL